MVKRERDAAAEQQPGLAAKARCTGAAQTPSSDKTQIQWAATISNGQHALHLQTVTPNATTALKASSDSDTTATAQPRVPKSHLMYWANRQKNTLKYAEAHLFFVE